MAFELKRVKSWGELNFNDLSLRMMDIGTVDAEWHLNEEIGLDETESVKKIVDNELVVKRGK